MKLATKRIGLSLLCTLVLAGAGLSQDREDRDLVAAAAGNLYVVYAKAGAVNYIEGEVTTKRLDGTSGQLVKGNFVNDGESVSTGNNGRAEILMNPGSFLRLNHNSEFRFESTSLSDLRVFVTKGTALFEVFASEDFKVSVESSKSRFYLIKSGVYRIDVDQTGNARLEVWRGKAQAGNADATVIKKGRSATINVDSVAVSRFDGDKDEFEQWSKDRAEGIARANRKLAADRLSGPVLSSYQNGVWDCYGSVGLWIFDRRFRSYSFLPFGMGWRSPYGFGLTASTPICYYPDYYFSLPRLPNRLPGGTGGGTGQVRNPAKDKDDTSGNGSAGNSGRTIIGGNKGLGRNGSTRRPGLNPTPPFQRMQETGSVRRTNTGAGLGGGFPGGGSSGGSSRGSGASRPVSGSKPSSGSKSTPSPRRVSPKVKPE